MPVPCTHKAGNHRSQVRPMGTQVPYRPGMESGPVMGAYLPVMLSSSKTILNSLIQGRSPSMASATPSSLLDVFQNPWRFREHSLTGLLSEVASQLTGSVESHLKRVPLEEEGKGLLASKLINLNMESNREVMQEISNNYGTRLLNDLGYEFEKKEDLGPVREFMLEVISLAEVGRRLCEWLEGNEGKITEDKRVGAIAELQVVVEMILERDDVWKVLQREEDNWNQKVIYYTAEDIKREYAEGQREFKYIRLFGNKEDRDFKGVNFEKVNFGEADLGRADFRGARIINGLSLVKAKMDKANLSSSDFRGADLREAHLEGADFSYTNFYYSTFDFANLQGADLRAANLSEASLEEANLQGADLRGAILSGTYINYRTLMSLDKGEWEGEKTLAQRINAWSARGGKISFLFADVSNQDLRGADLSRVTSFGLDKIENTKIDTKALETLQDSTWRDIPFNVKKNTWLRGGGIIVDEED